MFIGCSEDDSGSGSAGNYTALSGALSGTLRVADSPYHVTADIYVEPASTLTIEAGVQILFSGFFSFTVEGRLIAVGSPENNIVFNSTSTNTSNSRGNWEGIKFTNPNTTSIMEYCTIEDGALYVDYSEEFRGAIHCDGSSPVIKKCIMVDNGYNAVYTQNNAAPLIDGCTITHNAFSGVVADTLGKPTIINSIIVTNDDYGVVAKLNSQAAPRIEYSNVWDNITGDIFAIDTTGFPGLISLDPQFADPLSDFQLLSHSPCIDFGDPSTVIDMDGTRSDMGAYYYDQSDPSEIRNALSGTITAEYSPYLVTSDIWVEEGETLTIEAGVTFRFNAETTLRFSFDIYGALNITGTADNPVALTSSKTEPLKGDWKYLTFHDGCSAALDNCIIEFASEIFVYEDIQVASTLFNSLENEVTVDGVSPQFDFCAFDNSGGAGIVCDNYAAPLIMHSLFTRNQGYGLFCTDHSDASILNSIFYGNYVNGLRAEAFSQPEIINNLIMENGYYGIYLRQNADAVITNNIIYNNDKAGLYCLESSFPDIWYNDSYGNIDENSNVRDYYNCESGIGLWMQTNANSDSCDFQYNISLDPGLTSVLEELPGASPCSGAGFEGTATDMGPFGGSQGNWTPPQFFQDIIQSMQGN